MSQTLLPPSSSHFMARGDERKHLHLINQLWPCQDAAAGMVVPFLLHDIWMTIPTHIAAIRIDMTKCPGALVSNLLARCIIPCVQVWISCGLDLLVRGHVDRCIGIDIAIGAFATCPTGAEAGTHVGHRIVDGVAKGPVISAPTREAAAEADADILILGSEDEEVVVDVGFPTVRLDGLGRFLLNLGIAERRTGIGGGINP